MVAVNIKTINKNFFVFYTLILFVLGLNVPKISVLVIFVAFGVVFIRWRGEIIYDFLVQISLLLMFSLTYYVIMYFYEFKDFGYVILNPLFITASYAFGYSISRSNTPDWPYGIVWAILAVVAGFSVFSFLSVCSVLSSGNSTAILFRSAPSFWTGNDSINGPILGLFASLGLSLAPVLFFGVGQPLSKRYSALIIITVSLLVIAGLYVNITLQNRSPFIALLLSFVFSGFLYFFAKKLNPKHKINTIFFIITFLGILFCLSFYTGYDYSQYSVVSRFEVQGLETSRFDAWMYMLKALPENLTGGRLVYIGGLPYVHNLWLDIAYDAGILPMIFLLIFHLMHFKSFMIVIYAKLPLLLILIIVSISVSFLVGFIVEPVIQGSVVYFSANCFFLGLVRRLSNDIKLDQAYY